MNPRPLGYEPNELPDCSTPRHADARGIQPLKDTTLDRAGQTPTPAVSQGEDAARPDGRATSCGWRA